MAKNYFESLSKEDQIASMLRTLLRLYLSSQVRSRGHRRWSLQQLAIEFEIEQASRLAPQPHTVTSLAEALGLSVKVVSRTVRDLVAHGSVETYESIDDARVKYIVPTTSYYEHGGDGILNGIQAFLDHSFGESWRDLNVSRDADPFPSASLYTEATPKIVAFRRHFKFEGPTESSTSD